MFAAFDVFRTLSYLDSRDHIHYTSDQSSVRLCVCETCFYEVHLYYTAPIQIGRAATILTFGDREINK